MSNQKLIENQKKNIELFSKAPMKKTFGMELSYDEKGSAIFEMNFDSKFTHAFGSIHGGVLSTLIDNAGWFTASPNYDTWINTIDLQVQLIKPISSGRLISIGEIVNAGKSIAFTNMKVFDENKTLLAEGRDFCCFPNTFRP